MTDQLGALTIGRVTAKSEFKRLDQSRRPFLERAYQASSLTLPTLLPDREQHQPGDWKNLPTPWQGVGARGVNNISSKLLLSLLPPSTPFFRFVMDEFRVEQITDDPEAQEEFDKALAAMERAIMREVDTTSIRTATFEAFKHLIVTGNVLAHLPRDEGGMRVFHLDEYAVERDAMGEVFLIITKETLSPQTAPDEVLDLVSKDELAKTKDIDVYTMLSLEEDGKWHQFQEVNGEIVEGSEGKFPKDKLEYLPLRLSQISGEDYGRGLVEEYIGDLKSLEGLSKAIVENAAAAVRLLFLVNPNGLTRIDDLATKPNGGFAEGNADDVSTLQTQKQADLTVAGRVAERIEERLSRAFLLNSAITRQAERVTAEEIRFVKQELEDTLGGVYSLLTQEFQLPLVRLLMSRLASQNRLPTPPKGLVEPTIVTGLDALGRAHDLSRLQFAMSTIAGVYGPEAVQRFTKVETGIDRILLGSGVDPEGLVRSPEELQQVAQQDQFQALLQQFGNQLLEIVSQGVQQQQQPAQ